MARDPRLCPSLFDRLFDDAPAAAVDPQASRGMGPHEWRQAVLRDLQWLFDTTRRPHSGRGRAAGPASVIDYGLPALAGRPASSCDVEALARELADAILAFEPRLVPSSLRVVPDLADGEPPRRLLRFRIEARLRTRPMPLALLLRTEIDLESGRARLEEAA